MKKSITFIIIILTIGFTGCNSNPEDDFTKEFFSTVKNVGEEAASMIFWTEDGINLTPGSANLYKGLDEKPGDCLDFTLEFINLWNNVHNNDQNFVKAYIGQINGELSGVIPAFNIWDVEIAPRGTIGMREVGYITANTKQGIGWFGYYHDAVIKGNMYSGKPILHYGQKIDGGHVFPVFYFNNEWYEIDVGWADGGNASRLTPTKIKL